MFTFKLLRKFIR